MHLTSVIRRLFPPAEMLDGYEHSELVDVIFQKTKSYQPTEAWQEMDGVSSVLDFGGGCGLHYKQANSSSIRWAVVETPAMVNRAKELSTDHLQFFNSISAAAAWLGAVDTMFSNGALQCVPSPEETLAELCGLNAKTMLWQRTWLASDATEKGMQKSYLNDNGPGRLRIKEKYVRYPFIKIPERVFLNAHSGYSLVDRGPDRFRFRLQSLI